MTEQLRGYQIRQQDREDQAWLEAAQPVELPDVATTDGAGASKSPDTLQELRERYRHRHVIEYIVGMHIDLENNKE